MHNLKASEDSDDAIQLCGWLYISEPYVNILDPLSPDWAADVDFINLDLETIYDSVDIYWLHLPRSGTRYHPPSQSLWVWGGEPMTNGDYVCTGGSGESPPTRYPRKIHESNPWYAPGLGLYDPPPH